MAPKTKIPAEEIKQIKADCSKLGFIPDREFIEVAHEIHKLPKEKLVFLVKFIPFYDGLSEEKREEFKAATGLTDDGPITDEMIASMNKYIDEATTEKKEV